MADQSNVDRLKDAGAIRSDEHISDEHQRILNNDFTSEEIDAIVKLKDRVHNMHYSSDPDSTGGAML